MDNEGDEYDPWESTPPELWKEKAILCFRARRGMPFGSKKRAGNISATREFIGMYRRELERKAQRLKPSMVAWIGGRRLRDRA
jgi:hypothetical protein